MADRVIRDKIKRSRSLDRLSAHAEVLFYRLLTLTDGHGVFQADPVIVASSAFPLRRGLAPIDIAAWLHELQDAGIVSFYKADGEWYGVFRNWTVYNNLRSTKGSFPPMTTPVEWNPPFKEVL